MCPDEDYLTVIDVPGIFRNPTEGVTTRATFSLCKHGQEYIENNRTSSLRTPEQRGYRHPGNSHIRLRTVDKLGERTLGHINEAGLVTEQSAKVAVCNLVWERKGAYAWILCRPKRGADNDDAFNTGLRNRCFGTCLDSLPRGRLGVQALKARLSELLSQITRKEFPKLRKEVSKHYLIVA